MLSEAVPAALGAAIYPPALLFIAFLLVNPHPRKRALIFLAGAAFITLGFGFLSVFLLQSSGAESTKHRTVPAWIDLTIGIVLVAFAVVVHFRPPRGPKAAKKRREIGVIGLLGIGLLMYTPTALYLASLHAVAKMHSSLVVTVLSIILVAVIYMLLIEIPIIAHAIWPEPTIRWVTVVNTWLAKHGRTIIVVVAAGFGGYLIASGIAHLA
ncbi:GAP family protein [Amycolatopsis sp. FDAARGOS 1241]|uniref:GAP family protein n=1 Tax=Amycolatopsis sp. FDAARGOS 1241 TaxID=2778070 RepID=UPI00194DE4F0|nr:GAP family protein [Amycolatopsis sp. FDAARGOS 1241]QRP50431.1 GAP family protein [Amycolatopsis sp. FDAARGOS 1241]